MIQVETAYLLAHTTVTDTVATLADDFAITAEDLAAAEVAVITSRLAGVMYKMLADDPTPVSGHYLAQDTNVTIQGNRAIRNLRFVRGGGVDAAVTVTLLRMPGA